MSNISEEIKQFNEQLLSVSWKEAELSSCIFEKSSNINCSNLSEDQNNLIRNIVKYIPEWKRLIGCRQHNIHDFCLDIHTLLVIKNIQLHNDYEKLSDECKLILLYSALLHDVEKIENEVDTEHPAKGAKVSSIILYRLGFDEEFINNVYLMIRYHQILGFTISGKVNLSDDELCNMFKKPLIVDLQAILSIADIKSVKRNEALYKPEMEEKFEDLKKKIKSLIEERKK